MKTIDTLTGIRGVAVLVVFISHAGNEGLIPIIFGRGFGQVGVMLFFILSGFLMTHLYIGSDFKIENISKYALARIARVVPLYLFVLTFSIVVSNTFFPEFRFSFSELNEILLAYGFLYAPYVFWTIPVEAQFYFIFVLVWYLHQRRVNASLLLLLVVIIAAPSLIIGWAFQGHPRDISTYAFTFFIGVVTALNYDRIKKCTNIKMFLDYVGLILLILMFVNLPQLRNEYDLNFGRSIFVRTWADPITLGIVFLVFLSAMLNSKSLNFLKSKPFSILGEISYGVYLMHYPILVHLGTLNMNPLVQTLVAFVSTCLLAYFSLHCFERPLGKRIKNFRAVLNPNNGVQPTET